MPETPDLTEEEAKEILKALARQQDNAAAAIAALKELRQMGLASKPAEGGFDALDELTERRTKRSA